MTVSLASRLGLALVLSLSMLSACSSNDPKEPGYRPKNPFAKSDRNVPGGPKPAVTEQELKLEAERLYRVARGALEASDFAEATLRYDLISERYPFTEYATQAELEKIYVLHRDFKTDEALTAADRFLREHPRHPRADYVLYLKGVIQMERDQGLAELLPIDQDTKDVGNQRKAYDEFALLIQKYPSSRYNEDARARMMHLRNRIAANEMHVVGFYLKRGAWLAAAKRAELIIAQYPGAPATLDALQSMERSYRELGLTQEADDAARTLAAQRGGMTLAVAPLKVSDAAPPAAGGAAAPAQEGGFFTRMADFFSPLDRSNKEPVEIILPSASGTPEATPAEGAASADAKTGEAAKKKSNRLIVEINTGDEDEEAKKKKAEPAATEPANPPPSASDKQP